MTVEIPKLVAKTVVTRRINVKTGHIKEVGKFDPEDKFEVFSDPDDFKPDLTRYGTREKIFRIARWADKHKALESFKRDCVSKMLTDGLSKLDKLLCDLLIDVVHEGRPRARGWTYQPPIYRINDVGYPRFLKLVEEARAESDARPEPRMHKKRAKRVPIVYGDEYVSDGILGRKITEQNRYQRVMKWCAENLDKEVLLYSSTKGFIFGDTDHSLGAFLKFHLLEVVRPINEFNNRTFIYRINTEKYHKIKEKYDGVYGKPDKTE